MNEFSKSGITIWIKDLCRNKIDLKNRAVITEVGMIKANEHGIIISEAFSNEKINMYEVFTSILRLIKDKLIKEDSLE